MSRSYAPGSGGQYKHDHPEKAREYNARANYKRPNRNRDRKQVCRVCGEIKPHTHGATRCRECVQEDRR